MHKASPGIRARIRVVHVHSTSHVVVYTGNVQRRHSLGKSWDDVGYPVTKTSCPSPSEARTRVRVRSMARPGCHMLGRPHSACGRASSFFPRPDVERTHRDRPTRSETCRSRCRDRPCLVPRGIPVRYSRRGGRQKGVGQTGYRFVDHPELPATNPPVAVETDGVSSDPSMPNAESLSQGPSRTRPSLSPPRGDSSLDRTFSTKRNHSRRPVGSMWWAFSILREGHPVSGR